MTKNIQENQENSPTIHNVRLDSHFTVTFNKTPEDDRLSFAAKGLLWYLLSRPTDWSIYTKQLSSIYKGQSRGNGREAIENMINELKKYGYLKYTKSRNSNGTWQHRYDVYPIPYDDFQIKFPHTVKAHTAKAEVAKTPIITRNKVPRNDLKETTTCSVDVFLGLDIEEHQKTWISEKYDQKTIEDAIFYAIHPTTKIKTSLVATIKWACKEKIKYQQPKAEKDAFEKKEKEKADEDIIKKNKSLAEKTISENSHLFSEFCSIKLHESYVLLKMDSGYNPLDFIDKNFEIMLNSFIHNILRR